MATGFSKSTNGGTVHGSVVCNGTGIQFGYRPASHDLDAAQQMVLTPRQAKDLALSILDLLAGNSEADMRA